MLGQPRTPWTRIVCGHLLISCVATLALSGPALAQEGATPIMVFIDLHADQMQGPISVQQQMYQQWVDDMNWLLDVANPRGAKISFLSTGMFMEWVLEDPIEGQPLVQEMYAGGNQVGTHSHVRSRLGPHNWQNLGPNPSLAEIQQSWDDHVGYVNAVIQTVLGVTDPDQTKAINCARGSHIPADDTDRIQMMEDYGFTIHEGGGPAQRFYGYFGHYVMNPYRPSGADMLVEDPTGPVVILPAASVLGEEGPHGPDQTYQDNRLPAMQTLVLLEVLNWLHDVHVAETERVWQFGWGSHADDYATGQPCREATVPMLDWLVQHFVNQQVGGNVAATFASFVDVRDALYDWETAHPGASSFSYPATSTDWDLYPYLTPVARYLAEASYVDAMPAADTVRWHELTAAASAGGPFTMHVAYATDGVPITADLSGSLGAGQIAAINPATGRAHIHPTDAVEVPTIGTILVPTDKIIRLPGNGDFDEDWDVDLFDFAAFQRCHSGAGGAPLDLDCTPGDFDADDDVDLTDYADFHAVLTGAQ